MRTNTTPTARASLPTDIERSSLLLEQNRLFTMPWWGLRRNEVASAEWLRSWLLAAIAPRVRTCRVIPTRAPRPMRLDVADRLAAFDRAPRRRDERTPRATEATDRGTDEGRERRGWTREELHERGRPG